MTPTVETIISRWIAPPRTISDDDTLADLGLGCEAVLVSISCSIEEEILLDRELPDPAAIHRDMTVRDVVAVVERVKPA